MAVAYPGDMPPDDGRHLDDGYENIEDFLPLFGVREDGPTLDGDEGSKGKRGPLRTAIALLSGSLSMLLGGFGIVALILLIVLAAFAVIFFALIQAGALVF